ncbi:MAG: hypothetical protein IJR29_09360 [Butyrivibrio sp.]|nr:hypothetical protein [Butyrivibrio sp.]
MAGDRLKLLAYMLRKQSKSMLQAKNEIIHAQRKIKDMQNALNKNLHVKRTNKKHVACEK